MGYIEDLRDKRLEEFKNELLNKKEEAPEELLFKEDFSIFNFSCGIKDGYKMLFKLNKLIKVIKKRKSQMITKINEMCSNYKIEPVDGRNLSKKEKRDFIKGVKSILLELTNEESERIKKLEKMKRDIILRVGNIFLYIFTIALSFGFGGLLYLNNKIVNAIVYPASVIIILGFVTVQVLYTIKYLKAIKSTLSGIVVFSLKRIFSTSLVIWIYGFIFAIIHSICYSNDLALLISVYIFVAIFVIGIVFLIYDLFLSASIFDEVESTLSLIAAITIGLVTFADVFQNEIVTQSSSMLLLVACLLLTLLVVKKFIFDKKSLKDFLQLLYIAIITVVTISLTIVALYRLLWITPSNGQVADNTLFSAVVSVYAAFIGGGLTLTGVAWTIKHNEKLRKDEERSKYQPLFSYVYKKLDSDRLSIISCKDLEGINEIIDAKLSAPEWVTIENFAMENSSKIEFFICGLSINGTLYKTLMKELIKKDGQICFHFNASYFALNTIREIKLYVEDLIGNTYTIQLDFSIDEHNVKINGNKPIQFIGDSNE